MQLFFSSDVEKYLKKIKQKDSKLAERIEKQLTLFTKNPKHPSLRLHKLSGTIENRWSISITLSIRMVYIIVKDDDVLFVKIGTHDEVYVS